MRSPTPAVPVPRTGVPTSTTALPPQAPTPPRYQYPRDREVLEWDIEKALIKTLEAVVLQPDVRVQVERPKVARIFVQFVFQGARLDNAPQVLALVRDAVKLSIDDQFPGMRIHYRSRIRIREIHERFVYDYDFLKLQPLDREIDHDFDPFFRPLRLTRDRLIDLPTAFPLSRDVGGVTLSYFKRFLNDDRFSDVRSSRSEGLVVRLRQSFFDRFEMALTGTLYEAKVEPVQRGIFAESEGTLAVASLEAKYQVPYEINGFKLAFGFSQSFQEAGERVFFLPEDFDRFYTLYAVAGRRVYRHLIIHLGVKQSLATLEPLFPDRQVTTYGGGIEYRLGQRALMQLEILDRRISGDTFSRFGQVLDEGGITVNVGGVIGTRFGDLSVATRRLTDAQTKEYEVGLTYRW